MARCAGATLSVLLSWSEWLTEVSKQVADTSRHNAHT